MSGFDMYERRYAVEKALRPKRVGCANPCDDIERLKVCGTCENRRASWADDYCKLEHRRGDRLYVGITDHCYFEPSRWTPYWEKP